MSWIQLQGLPYMNWVLLLMTATICAASDGNSTSTKLTGFPGRQSTLLSPNGKYLLINVDADSETVAERLGNNHALYVMDLASTKSVRVVEYGRSVAVAWSPSGDTLAINIHEGSSDTTCMVCRFEEKENALIVVEQKLDQVAAKFAGETFRQLGHQFVEALCWISEDQLEIRIHGYNGENEKFDAKACYLLESRTITQLGDTK
ncbi:MAG: hypothetical protein AMXMBFR84_10250 [Candidatus Hydrogenedentota bacterium]